LTSEEQLERGLVKKEGRGGDETIKKRCCRFEG